MASPILGIPEPSSADTRDYWYQHLNTAVDAAEPFFVGRFATEAVRDLKITSPQRGMFCWCTTPGGYFHYNGTAWAPPPPRVGVYKQTWQTQTLTQAVTDLTTFTFLRPYAFAVQANASIKGDKLMGAAALWINQGNADSNGQFGATTRAIAEITGNLVTVNCSAYLIGQANVKLTVRASVNLVATTAGISLNVFNDTSHSFLQCVEMPLGGVPLV